MSQVEFRLQVLLSLAAFLWIAVCLEEEGECTVDRVSPFCVLCELVLKGPEGILEKTDDKGKIVSPVPRLRSFPVFFPS